VAGYAAANGVHPAPASPTTEYAYRLGEMLIQADASDCKWLVSDHLGSPRIILGKSGSLADVRRRDFMPFGEDLGAGQFGRTTAPGYEASGTPSNLREKFATYERDDETGLDFAQARYYQSKLGRFTSVDPLMASAAPIEPQSWNRYGYVGNRPLVVTDPTGMVWGYNKDQNKYQWFVGDELTDELKNEGWSATNVGREYMSENDHRILLGANGRWVDLGYAGPILDFQHGAGTDSIEQFSVVCDRWKLEDDEKTRR
jgi:RHS repeat-associated protein